MTQRTYLLVLGTVALDAVQCASGGAGSVERVLIHNPSGGIAFLAHAPTADAAQTAAVIPLAGTPASVVALGSKSNLDLTMPPGHFWSGIVATGTATVYLTVTD